MYLIYIKWAIGVKKTTTKKKLGPRPDRSPTSIPAPLIWESPLWRRRGGGWLKQWTTDRAVLKTFLAQGKRTAEELLACNITLKESSPDKFYLKRRYEFFLLIENHLDSSSICTGLESPILFPQERPWERGRNQFRDLRDRVRDFVIFQRPHFVDWKQFIEQWLRISLWRFCSFSFIFLT